jgi:hypothetical protein
VTDSRCFVPDKIAPVLATGQVIASAIGQGTAVATVSGIVAATGRARRIVPKAVAIAPRPAVEIAPRPPIAVAALRAETAEAVAVGP